MTNYDNLIDWEFISTSEGGRILKGYVPPPDGGAIDSGVTIATGFDIGQRNPNDLATLPLHIRTVLREYCGVTGKDAVTLCNKHPLLISDEDAVVIDAMSHKEAIDNLLYSWKKANSCISFYCLDIKLRTVIMDVAFQYGNLAKRTPNFWGQVTTGDWQGAYFNLLNFGDAYKTRRNREAQLVKEVLYNGLV